MPRTSIGSPDDPRLDELCDALRERSADLDQPGAWPAEQLRLCGQYGVYEWFLEPQCGGQGWSEADVVRGYLRLSAACLTTTFVITQRTGACQRIAMSDSAEARQALLPDLIAGSCFATVGISHLTTSRRHLAEPVLKAEQQTDHFVLDGYSPWVTGAAHADAVVVGATLEDGREILLAAPTDLPGVNVPAPAQLVGLSASHTGPIQFEACRIDRKWLLAGPVEGVMQQGTGARTGGLQTSTLALGLADAALAFLQEQSRQRGNLGEPAEAMRAQWERLETQLLAAADGNADCSAEELRIQANSIALRSSQAALAAAKGAGYVLGHPAGRWCREALFFLVWSCPQPVMAAHLCELAQLEN